IRLDAHVEKPTEYVDDVVGVNRREHQMPRKRRLNRDLSRFRIANLTHHDLVRVVPEDRSQTTGKGQALFLVDRDLRNPSELILDGILDRDDLVLDRFDFRQCCVKRRRLAGAGGPRDEDHTIRLADVLSEAPKLLLREAENVELQLRKLLADRLLV